MPRLVERNDELAVLTAALGDLGGGRLMLLEGEAGSGKSELLRAALADAPADLVVLVGSCEPLDIPAAFSPLFELLSELPDELTDQIRAGSNGLAVYSAVLDLLRSRRTLLVIDDAQWADPATVELLRYVGRRITDTPSVLVIAFRTDGNEDIAELIGELGARATRIELGALSIEGVRELTKGSGLDADTVLHRTGGNPFFVSEVARHPNDEVPTTVGEAVASRLRQLSIGTQHLVEMIALCPDGLDVDVAVGLGSEASAHIDAACERKLLVVDGDRVRFRHELIRSGIALAIPPLRRRDIHRQLATALEPRAITRRDISHLSFHFAESGDGRRSIDYSMLAATDAIGADAHRTAADNLGRALDHRELMSDDELDGALDLAATEFLHVGRFEEAIRAAEDRLEIAGDDAHRAAVLAQLSFCWTRFGGCVQGRDLAEQSLRLMPPSNPGASALAQRVLGSAAVDGGEWDAALAHFRTSIEQAIAAGDAELRTQAMNTAGLVLHILGDSDGLELMQDAYHFAVEHELFDAAAGALNNVACALSSAFRLADARIWFERGVDLCASRQLDSWHMSLLSALALAELRAGNTDGARSHLASRLPGRCSHSSAAEARGVRLRIDMRSTGAAGGTLELAFADLDSTSTVHWDRVDLLAQVAEAAWLGVCEPGRAYERLTAAYATTGFLDDSWACGQAAFWAIRLGHDLPPGSPAGPFGLEARGEIEQAAVAWDDLGCPYEAALTRARIADPPIADIATVLTDLGAPASLAAVRRDLRARGVDVRSERDHPSGLTPRQLDVLGLLGDGLSNAQIAERLFISQKTAGHHVSAILARTGVASRGEAVAFAHANAWL